MDSTSQEPFERLPSWMKFFMRPRDIAEARRSTTMALLTVALGLGLMAAVDLVFSNPVVLIASLGSEKVSLLHLVVLPSILIAGAITIQRIPDAWVPFTTLPIALWGSATTGIVAIVSNEPGLTGQVFFYPSILFAAYVLSKCGARLTLLWTLAWNAALQMCTTTLPTALGDWVTLSLVLTGLVVTLGWARDRHDTMRTALSERAIRDALTGLYNRQHLDRTLPTVNDDPGELGGALLVVDLDHFKAINDGYGHPTGDEVLRRVAAVSSTVGAPRAVACRVGGDELAIYIPDCSLSEAEDLAAKLVNVVRSEPVSVTHSRNISVSVSVGVAHWPTHGLNETQLYAAADAGLYCAKRSGRSRHGVAGTCNADADCSGPSDETLNSQQGRQQHNGRQQA